MIRRLGEALRAEEEATTVDPLADEARKGGKRAGLIALARDFFILKKYCFILFILLTILAIQLVILFVPQNFSESAIAHDVVNKMYRIMNSTNY